MNEAQQDELILRLIDGDLSRDEQRALAAELERSPATRKALAAQLRREGMLAGLVQTVAPPPTPEILAAMCEAVGTNSEQSQQAPSRWLRVGVLLATAASLLFFWALGRGWPGNRSTKTIPSDAQPVAVLNEVGRDIVLIRNGKSIQGHSGMSIGDGDQVSAPEGSQAAVRLLDQRTMFLLNSGTTAGFRLVRGLREVRVEQGQIFCDVEKQQPGEPLVLVTRQARATVLGTRFTLDANGDRTRVEVTEGRVRVADTQTDQTVDTEAGWSAEVGGKGTLQAQRFEAVQRVLPVVRHFVLLDCKTRDPVPGHELLTDGAVINLAHIPGKAINVVAVTEPTSIGAVWFDLLGHDPAGNRLQIENKKLGDMSQHIEVKLPYTLAGDSDHNPPRPAIWKPAVGHYRLEATPYLVPRDRGSPGVPLVVEFDVIDQP